MTSSYKLITALLSVATLCPSAHAVSAEAGLDVREVAFVEGSLRDRADLMRGMSPGVEVHVLDSRGDGLAQMAEVLSRHAGLDAVHLYSHGAPGRIDLGALALRGNNVETQAARLARIGAALKPGGDLMLYGCEVGRDTAGRALVADIARLSGADVAASSDITGNAALGGNWILEVRHGRIETANALLPEVQARYSDVLPSSVPTATPGAERVDVSGAAAGATVRLYLTNGSLQGSGTAAADGTYRFEDVLPNTLWYYVTQDDGVNGESVNTPFFNVTLRTPVATPGTELVDVDNVSASATIKLYLTNGTLVSDSPTDQGGGVYRFSNVTPSSLGFYVIQTFGVYESLNTPFFGIPLRTPDITAGVRQVDVENVFPGATVTLHRFNGTVVSSSPTDIGGGVFRFSNVDPDSAGHYVVQSINGVVSDGSSLAFVTESAPSFVGGLSTFTVNAVGTEFRDQLAVSDVDAGQTLTWSVTGAPGHGSLSGFPATASTNCSNGICGTTGSTVSRPDAEVRYTPDAGYTGSDTFTIAVSDGVATTSRSFTVTVNSASGATVSAADSAALRAAIDNPAVATINLSSGASYSILGTEINRPLTINGNDATIEVLGGTGQSLDDQTIFHLGMPDASGNRRHRGNLFWRVSDGGNLTLSNLTLRNAATSVNAQGLTGVFAAVFLTGTSNASLSGVRFENFWFQNANFMAQNNLANAQGLYASYSDISHGVYADFDFQGDLSVTGSTFGSSNAFREAVHLYNSQSATISNNTLTGTAHPGRLRAADGFENGIYVFGGNSTITGNIISGYQAHLNSDYYSAGIASVGFFAGGSATITGNTITNCSTGLSLAGGWQAFQPGSELSVNGYSLIDEPGLAGFALGHANTLGNGVHGPRIAIVRDQNDSAYAYADPYLTYGDRTPDSVTLGLAANALPAIDSAGFTVQQSLDGSVWSNATVTPAGPLTAANTTFTVTGLDPAARYFFRLNDTDSASSHFGWSNLVALPTLTLGTVGELSATVSFQAPGTTGVRIEKSTDGGASWSTATLASPITAASTSATVTGLTAGTAHLLRINGAGTSGWGASAPVALTTDAAASCGTASNVPSVAAPSGSGLCAAGTASPVTAGSPWTWSCTSDEGGTPASCSAPNAPTATGSGGGRLEITASSGATAWQVDSASFVSVASTGSDGPAGLLFPHGLLALQLDSGTAGTSATVTITYPSALPPGSVYWKYGRTASNPSAHWYPYPGATVAGNTVVLTLTDGADGDDDRSANSVIVDPGGPAVPAALLGIPTLSQWGQTLLLALLALAGLVGVRRRMR